MRLNFLLSLTFLASCASAPNFIKKNNIENNSKLAMKSPYVLVISIDGYRHDYTEKFKPPFISEFKKESASLNSLRPSYPTKTFPNHLSIMTGRYPMNHGIVANQFYAPDLGREYSLRDRTAVEDGRFYTAKPLWALAEEQGMRTATYFWPGSEAEIQRQRPSYYLKYNHGTPHEDRINTVVEWFKMPEATRPHLATVYFHDVDSAGHNYGPMAEETKNAVMKVDNSIKELVTELKSLDIPIHIILVSDHGMAQLSQDNLELIAKSKQAKNLVKNFKVIGKGPVVHLYRKSPKFKYITKTINAINKDAKNFKCYKKSQTPKKLNFRNNSRIGNIVCLANKDWSITLDKISVPAGNHGWSQYEGRDMHAIFYAQGPKFKKSYELETQDNINIYPLLANILNLKIEHKIDGKLQRMKPLLK